MQINTLATQPFTDQKPVPKISMHRFIYTFKTGVLKGLNVRYSKIQEMNDIYQLEKLKSLFQTKLDISQLNAVDVNVHSLEQSSTSQNFIHYFVAVIFV